MLKSGKVPKGNTMAKDDSLKPNPSYARTAEGITPIPKPNPRRKDPATTEDIESGDYFYEAIGSVLGAKSDKKIKAPSSMRNPTQRPYSAKDSPFKYSERIGPKKPKTKYDQPIGPSKPKTGNAVVAAPASPPAAASDKSRVAGKMTAFQRMKARQYEKEGVGGRPMTRAVAQKKAMSEKSGSLKMPSLGRLFAKQGKVTFAQPPKKGATPAQLAAFKAKMQGRNK